MRKDKSLKEGNREDEFICTIHVENEECIFHGA